MFFCIEDLDTLSNENLSLVSIYIENMYNSILTGNNQAKIDGEKIKTNCHNFAIAVTLKTSFLSSNLLFNNYEQFRPVKLSAQPIEKIIE
jgi:hypothetical protein